SLAPVPNLRQKLIPPADPSSFRPLFEQVLAQKEREFGATAPPVARSASDLGLFLKSLDEYEAALAPLAKALQIDQTNSDAKLASDQENLASVLSALDRHAETLPLLQAAAKGNDAAVAARSLSMLATLDPANSETYYLKAIDAEEQASGKDHPRVATLLNNL